MFPARALVDDLPLIYNKTISACSSPELLSTAPYGIIICNDNSGSPFSAQVYAVASSKVAAAIFVSESPEFLFYTLYYPGVVISLKDALAVISYVERHAKPTASVRFQQTVVGTKPAPAVASYTSQGRAPSYSGILKPDVMAPGTFYSGFIGQILELFIISFLTHHSVQ
ncbi:hypothetical protein RJ639_021785 [Escallonia herrerae]|uniref:PA domain-containing protein n=1 Tax=Escallonia herrerae TaxID=1293975 RepID=A0AA89AGY3_9ASTE|nr:hypothetical protein RJ639_021785 [Escallonia herrerae]